jgi:hypothetical protein
MVEHAHHGMADRLREDREQAEVGLDAFAIELRDRLVARSLVDDEKNVRLRCPLPGTLRRLESARAAQAEGDAHQRPALLLRAADRLQYTHCAAPGDSAARSRRADRRCRRVHRARGCRGDRGRGPPDREVHARERRAASAARALRRVLCFADGTDADVLGHPSTLPAPRHVRKSEASLGAQRLHRGHVPASRDADHPHTLAVDRACMRLPCASALSSTCTV